MLVRLSSFLLAVFLSAYSVVSHSAAAIFGVPPSLVTSYVAACASSGASDYAQQSTDDYYTGTNVVEGQFAVVVQIVRRYSGSSTCRTLAKDNYCAAGGQPDTSVPPDKACPDPPPPESCVSPLVKVGDKCVDPCASKSGKTTGKVYLTLNGSDFAAAQADLKSTFCVSGCTVSAAGGGFSANDIVYTKLGGGVRKYYLNADFSYSGSSCKVGATDNSSKTNATDGKPGYSSDGSNPPVCKSGEQSGIVNGKPVCLKQQTGSGGITFGVTPESNPNNATDGDGNVTGTGTDSGPATGSFSKFCQDFPASPSCSSGDGNGTGETGTAGTGTGTTGTGTQGTGNSNTSNCPGCATEATLSAVKGLLDPNGVSTGVGDGTAKAGDSLDPIKQRLDDSAGGVGAFSGLTWEFASIFPAAADCQPLEVKIDRLSRDGAKIDYCWALALVRSILGWIIYVITLIAVFNIATGKPASTGGKE